MKRLLIFLLVIFSVYTNGQSNVFDGWEDYFSYNDVKDFLIVDNNIYAVVGRSMFIYDLNTQNNTKVSTVDGLSGELTTSVFFDPSSRNVMIGYENGFIDLYNIDNKDVKPITGITTNGTLLSKRINGFYQNEENTYVFGDFGLLEIDVNKRETGGSFKISSTSIPTEVNDAYILKNKLYAATQNGLYSILLDGSDPIDLVNWTKLAEGNITKLTSINNELFFSKGKTLFKSKEKNKEILIENLLTEKNDILVLSNYNDNLVVSTSQKVSLYQADNLTELNRVDFSLAKNYSITTNKALLDNNNVYVGTPNHGVLTKSLESSENIYAEIHPEGPSSNKPFSITADNGNIWISYGGYSSSFNFIDPPEDFASRNVSGRHNNKWYNIPFSDINANNIIKIETDPLNPSRIYLASYNNGIKLFDYDKISDLWINTAHWTDVTTKGGIEKGDFGAEPSIPYLITDNNDKLWVANSFARGNNLFSSYNPKEKKWEALINFASVISRVKAGVDVRISRMFVHNDGNIFAGTDQHGILIFKDTYNQSISNQINNAIDVLDPNILLFNQARAVVVDKNDRIWIGNDEGLVVYDDYESIFDNTVAKKPAEKIIIKEGEKTRELFGNVRINDLIIDKAETIWVATHTSGVFNISGDGQTTFHHFNSSNSPLPSDVILDLELDEDTGLIYIVTDRGVVSFDKKAEPFNPVGEITDVVVYPNPAISNKIGHEEITIVAKDGKGLPDGTNVKILDVSGKLVFETNIASNGQSEGGGKATWDKKNLRGNLVTSGIYIVLLSNADGTENTTTKIAIVN